MRTHKAPLVLAALLPLTLVAAPASADADHVYKGVFTGTTDRDGCVGENPPLVQSVSGQWHVTLKDDGSAVPNIQLFYDGRPHLAFGGAALGFTQAPAGFPISADVGSGVSITMNLVDSEFTYTVAPYQLFGYMCDSLTLKGTLK